MAGLIYMCSLRPRQPSLEVHLLFAVDLDHWTPVSSLKLNVACFCFFFKLWHCCFCDGCERRGNSDCISTRKDRAVIQSDSVLLPAQRERSGDEGGAAEYRRSNVTALFFFFIYLFASSNCYSWKAEVFLCRTFVCDQALLGFLCANKLQRGRPWVVCQGSFQRAPPGTLPSAGRARPHLAHWLFSSRDTQDDVLLYMSESSLSFLEPETHFSHRAALLVL